MEQLITFIICFSISTLFFVILTKLLYGTPKKKISKEETKPKSTLIFIEQTKYGLLYQRPDGTLVHFRTFPDCAFGKK